MTVYDVEASIPRVRPGDIETVRIRYRRHGEKAWRTLTVIPQEGETTDVLLREATRIVAAHDYRERGGTA